MTTCGSQTAFTNATAQGVVVRTLRLQERRSHTTHPQTPLVIEAGRESSIEVLERFLDKHSGDVLTAVTQHGAVLLRGFSVENAVQFERVALSVRGLHCMRDVFMSEAGRTVVYGTRNVLHTNTLYKTGGSLNSFSFHTENFYVPDVPRYILFFCRQPSWLGGETGLIDMAALYADLPDSVKSRLSEKCCLVAQIPAIQIQQRYGIGHKELASFFSAYGFTLRDNGDSWDLLLYKPCVLIHPESGVPALQVNLAGELNARGLQRHALREFRADFAGPQWFVHRLYWHHPNIRWLGDLLRQPIKTVRRTIDLISRKKFRTEPAHVGRFAECFEDADISYLAKAMRRHYSAFRWCRGDILIVDNLRMAHSGMPGLGTRDLNALICNRVPMPCHDKGTGRFVAAAGGNSACIGESLKARVPR
jgi:alpha-ketoglutarate-dependent taurine dioxygenase